MASVFVLLGMMAFGVSNVIWKPLLTDFTVNTLLFRRSCWSALILSILLAAGTWFFFRPEWVLHLTARQGNYPLSHSIGLSIFYILVSLSGLYLFIFSLKLQPVGISGMVVCTSTLLSALLGWIIMNEPFHPVLVFSLSISTIGMLLMDQTSLRRFHFNKGIGLALLGASCWGFANLGFKKMIPETGVLQFSLLQEAVVLAISGAAVWWTRRGTRTETVKASVSGNAMIFFISLCTVVGVVFCNLGMKELPISRFALLVLAQPLSTFVIAGTWLAEKTTLEQKTGALLILVGIYSGIAF